MADEIKGETLAEQFESAKEYIKTAKFSKTVPNDRKLALYGFFKQINDGDVTGERPGMFNFEAKSKWDAWKKCEGMDKDTCMKGYVDELKSQIEEFK
eukprot:CAMPEP_0194782604 /NCGR_PEP_ID=MMETSP0323_2-20130528/78779_1 /TAXON_ID=2866 ORGANISM="Crypthecodinium cohnii, Strain Seligo" /NCGR_SAMPLE_ID=MMETSP0323_2 /ASSEMBLY_ACC=CAM_ASM_000346 /LENGTH=96 /DNA_ID=CAMNT_0039721431 /DNA_START=59 /DNA_END=349 /DNA_ORIENTATION=+